MPGRSAGGAPRTGPRAETVGVKDVVPGCPKGRDHAQRDGDDQAGGIREPEPPQAEDHVIQCQRSNNGKETECDSQEPQEHQERRLQAVGGQQGEPENAHQPRPPLGGKAASGRR